MRRRLIIFSLPLLLLAVGVVALRSAAEDRPPWFDLNGAARDPLRPTGAKAGVLLFIQHDCPISNRYAPEINRIEAEYAPKGVAFTIVYEDPDLPAAEARRHAREYGYRMPALLDPTHLLARKVGATITPEAVVIAPDAKVVYRGRIDDLYADLAHARLKPTIHDLRLALTAILAGKLVPNPSTRAIGCFIPTNE
jgi:hypothetical protein